MRKYELHRAHDAVGWSAGSVRSLVETGGEWAVNGGRLAPVRKLRFCSALVSALRRHFPRQKPIGGNHVGLSECKRVARAMLATHALEIICVQNVRAG